MCVAEERDISEINTQRNRSVNCMNNHMERNKINHPSTSSVQAKEDLSPLFKSVYSQDAQ